MKSCRLLLMCLLVFTTGCSKAPKTKEDFLAAIRAACEAKDMKRIHELTWEKDCSESDRQISNEFKLKQLENSSGVESINYVPLPPDFGNPLVAGGRRYELTYPATGMVHIVLKPNEENKKTAGSSPGWTTPYAVIGGRYHFVTTKSTDLGWKGPQDKMLNVTVTGAGQDKVAIHVKYNASGVELERDLESGTSFPGQFIEEVTVVSDTDSADVTLELREIQQYPAEPSYKSAPLKGKGQIHYKKGDVGVPSK